jgi:hypothetical protein
VLYIHGMEDQSAGEHKLRPLIWPREHSDIELLLLLLALLRHQVPQRQVVHHILNVLDPVLQPIAAAAQAVVLEVEHLETRMQVLDELVDEQRALVVTESNGVACKAGLS